MKKSLSYICVYNCLPFLKQLSAMITNRLLGSHKPFSSIIQVCGNQVNLLSESLAYSLQAMIHMLIEYTPKVLPPRGEAHG